MAFLDEDGILGMWNKIKTKVDSIMSDISALENAKHTHNNKNALDKFSYDSDSRFRYGNYYVGVINTDNPNSVYGTWSGSKINTELGKKQNTLSNATVLGKLSDNNGSLAYNGNTMTGIDDTMDFGDSGTTWSSGKIVGNYGVPSEIFKNTELEPIPIPSDEVFARYDIPVATWEVLRDYRKFNISFYTDTDTLMPEVTFDNDFMDALYHTGGLIYKDNDITINLFMDEPNEMWIEVYSKSGKTLDDYIGKITISKIEGVVF